METVATATETAVPTKTRVYLLSALTTDSAKAITELTHLVASAGSKVEKTEDLGLKKLAFPINKRLELSLVSIFFAADADIVKAIDLELKHTGIVERFLLTTWKADLNPPKRRGKFDATKDKEEKEERVDV